MDSGHFEAESLWYGTRMLTLLLALPLFAVVDPGILAPGPVEWTAQVRRLEQKLGDADALGAAEARIHNHLAQGPIPGRSLCATGENRSLVTRSALFGAAYRDAVQAARADGTRLRRMLGEPTLQPLLWKEERQRAEALLERVEAHVVRYREMAAWQRRHLAQAVKSCPTELVAAEGMGGVATAKVAVVGVGGGTICPFGMPADGTVVVLPRPEACHSPGADCGCTPVPQAPGAVIGPAPGPEPGAEGSGSEAPGAVSKPTP